METAITTHLQQQALDRQPLLNTLHEIILQHDPSVIPTVGSMMGKEMILYNCKGMFKYGLASVKDHMSLHCLPIYANPVLHTKYVALLPEAKVQKGCVNFKNETEMPAAIAAQLITDCTKIDLHAIREKYLSEKKKK